MIIKLETDPETGDLVLPLGDEVCKELGWEIGDTIKWNDNGDGSWSLRKLFMKDKIKQHIEQYITREHFSRYGETITEDRYEIYPEEMDDLIDMIVVECANVCYNSGMEHSDVFAQNLLYTFNIDNARNRK